MKNVYLIQPNNALSDSVYLPYSAGCLAAYAFARSGIRSEYRFRGFLYEKKDIADVIGTFEEPYLIGFSSYMWNVEYNLQLAKRVKAAFPDCIIVFGGPQIPDDTEYLCRNDFIDILIHGEGEKPFYEILDRKPLPMIDNISFRSGAQPVKNRRTAPAELADHPSPYTAGFFDDIIHAPENAGKQFDAILETNRGCPYKCIYCCWSKSGTGFRRFPMAKVKDELAWMAKNGIAYCFCADGNFGILPRDEEIAEYVAALKSRYGYPEKFETTSAKDKDEVVFGINKKLEDAGLNRGVSIAVQSMTPAVLNIIGRKGMSVEELSSQLKRYRDSAIFTYTDLILGLPGETYESFCKSLFDVIEAGQHTSINIFCLELLPNTKLYSKEFAERYKIKTVVSRLCQNHSVITEDDGYGSRSEIVVQTDTMSPEEWRDAVIVSNCTLCFHCMGLLRYVAVYFREARGMSYHDFYLSLFEEARRTSGVVRQCTEKVFRCMEDFLAGRGNLEYYNEAFGNIYFPFDEGLFLECVSAADAFYDEICRLLQCYGDPELEDLIRYQKALISLPSQKAERETFAYDWYDYFRQIRSGDGPEKKKVTLEFSASSADTVADYAKQIVWCGKRSNKMIRTAVRVPSEPSGD